LSARAGTRVSDRPPRLQRHRSARRGRQSAIATAHLAAVPNSSLACFIAPCPLREAMASAAQFNDTTQWQLTVHLPD
jgi:hypothetical protein